MAVNLSQITLYATDISGSDNTAKPIGFICLGEVTDAWEAKRHTSGFTSHEQFAWALLKAYEQHRGAVLLDQLAGKADVEKGDDSSIALVTDILPLQNDDIQENDELTTTKNSKQLNEKHDSEKQPIDISNNEADDGKRTISDKTLEPENFNIENVNLVKVELDDGTYDAALEKTISCAFGSSHNNTENLDADKEHAQADTCAANNFYLWNNKSKFQEYTGDFVSSERAQSSVMTTVGANSIRSFQEMPNKIDAASSIIAVNASECSIKCKHCPETFYNHSDVRFHEKNVHGMMPCYRCDFCNRTFTQRNNYEDHIRSHTGERPFECNVCSKRFTSKKSRQQHSKFHGGPGSLLKCSICDKLLASASKMVTHMRSHTGEKPFQCSECPQSYATKQSLQTHIQINHVEAAELYKCTQCDKVFKTMKHARQHMVTHSEVKRHVCAVCGNAFKRRSQLNSHARVHKVRERSYVCNICGAGFMERVCLKRHESTHITS